MKYLFALFSVLVLYNCSTRAKYTLDSKKPIVDYSTNYESNDRMLSYKSAYKKQIEKTVVLINNKVSNIEKFDELVKNEKIKKFNIIKDQKEIEHLNYSYDKVKTVIIATKK